MTEELKAYTYQTEVGYDDVSSKRLDLQQGLFHTRSQDWQKWIEENTSGKVVVKLVISCLLLCDESLDRPSCHCTGNSQFLFTATWRPLKKLQIVGLVSQATTKSESRKEVPDTSHGSSSKCFWGFICYHIRVRLHFPRFARTRHGVLCNGSLRDPNVQTGIPEDRSASE